ncbi:DUF167 domain-containing protein [Patescibacteria group bacterium]|nr:DUF167 domain-containing protein [Patescibacteria group bacterium]MBU1123974.1 DUF167 domain-containing protein [Patescibacteria group bacterium]MBU1911829.1 DUF167 domain-containing protein [Patescibacteria group bacterium]
MLSHYKAGLKKLSAVVFYVRAVPNAPKSKVLEVMEDESVKIAIAAPADKGKANAELIKFLSKEFGVPKSNVEIITGAKQRIKLVGISLSP